MLNTLLFLYTVGPGAPEIVEDLKDVSIALQGQVLLKVDAVSEGSLTYVWQRSVEDSTEWKVVPSETKYQGQGTPSLAVTNVEETDAGLFRCLVSSEGGETVTKHACLRIGWFLSLDISYHLYFFTMYCTVDAPKIVEDLEDVRDAPHSKVSLKVS